MEAKSRKLQTYQDKDQAVQHEGEGLPERPDLNAHRRENMTALRR